MPQSSLSTLSKNSSEILGTPLPAQEASTITQGGPPNFADTYITPLLLKSDRRVFSWKAQFDCGQMANGGCAIAVGAQLKVLRPVAGSSLLRVVAEGAAHNPLAEFQSRFGGACPWFPANSNDAVLEFTEAGLAFSAGDMVGLTLMSDPNSQGYFYPLLPATSATRLVLRNAPVGDSIDLSDPYTATLAALTPAVLLNLGIAVSIDIQPGAHDHQVHLHSNALVAVAIFSDASFDATTIDPATITFAGAPLETAGRSGGLMCQQADVNHDGLTGLVCDFRASQLNVPLGDSIVVLEGSTLNGVPIRGQAGIKAAA